MTSFLNRDDRRAEPRRPVSHPGVVLADRQELACVLVDVSPSGLRVRLARDTALPETVVVIDVHEGRAHEARIQWRKGRDAGLRRLTSAPLRGLVPQRLTFAREAWLRAGGR